MKQTVEQAFKKLPISYVGDIFKEWFFPMTFNPKAKCQTLTGHKLPHMMNDVEIQKELNPGEVSIEEIVATLKTMDKSIWAIFYCKDKDSVLRAVGADWNAKYGGWGLHAYSVLNPHGWRGGRQVFSRNSRSTSTLPSDPLPLGSSGTSALEKRVEALEKKLSEIAKIL